MADPARDVHHACAPSHCATQRPRDRAGEPAATLARTIRSVTRAAPLFSRRPHVVPGAAVPAGYGQRGTRGVSSLADTGSRAACCQSRACERNPSPSGSRCGRLARDETEACRGIASRRTARGAGPESRSRTATVKSPRTTSAAAAWWPPSPTPTATSSGCCRTDERPTLRCRPQPSSRHRASAHPTTSMSARAVPGSPCACAAAGAAMNTDALRSLIRTQHVPAEQMETR